MERVSRQISVSLAHTQELFLLALKCLQFFRVPLKAMPQAVTLREPREVVSTWDRDHEGESVLG